MGVLQEVAIPAQGDQVLLVHSDGWIVYIVGGQVGNMMDFQDAGLPTMLALIVITHKDVAAQLLPFLGVIKLSCKFSGHSFFYSTGFTLKIAAISFPLIHISITSEESNNLKSSFA